jgi:4-amino-4-deoxy-L-arabinose transferase-like glycosyltransferase
VTVQPVRALTVPNPVIAVAAACGVLLLATANRYGPHRDELYFIAAGQHPAWGYPDQPPLTPLLAEALDAVHHSLPVLRSVSALMVVLIVLLTADLTRALGGSPTAQLLAAVVTATGPAVLAIGHLLSTATVDLLIWTALVRLVVHILQRERPRLWVLVGLVLGVGLENKHLPALLAAGLVAGMALTPAVRHHLRTPWPWLGAVVALALWAPNLWWQARHGWPQLTIAADIREEVRTLEGSLALVGFQLLLLGPIGGALAAVGLVAGLRNRLGPFFRPIAVAYLVILGLLLVSGGKHYYLLGLLPPLAAGGAVAFDRWLSSRRMRALVVVAAVSSLVSLPSGVPLLPERDYAGSLWEAMNPDQLNTIGWPRYVEQVRGVLDRLPASERAGAVLVTQNYGEAGAWQWYDGSVPVFSGHNGFAAWGPPDQGSPVLVVSQTSPSPSAFIGCQDRARIEVGVDTEETGTTIWVCDGPTDNWELTWTRLTRLAG